MNKFVHLHILTNAMNCNKCSSNTRFLLNNSMCTHIELFKTNLEFFESMAVEKPIFDNTYLMTVSDSNALVFSVEKQASHISLMSEDRIILKLTAKSLWRCDCNDKKPCDHIRQTSQKCIQNKLISTPESFNYEENDYPTAPDSTSRLSVSYLSIPPIPASKMPWDLETTRMTFPIPLPTLFKLDSLSKCAYCGQLYSNTEIKVVETKLWDYSGCYEVKVETSNCGGHCKNGDNIGPDLSQFAIFNYSNKHLFTHFVLDSYTASMATSETPFISFISLLQYMYSRQKIDSIPPPSKVFRNAWFDYIRLQNFDSRMTCPQCGSEPEIVIADGISMGYTAKFKSGTLKPPTAISPTSLHRPQIRTSISKTFLQLSLAAWTKNDINNFKKTISEFTKTCFTSWRPLTPTLNDDINRPDFPPAFKAYINLVVTARELSLLRLMEQLTTDEIMFVVVPPTAFLPLKSFLLNEEINDNLFLTVPILQKIHTSIGLTNVDVKFFLCLMFNSLVKLINSLSRHNPNDASSQQTLHQLCTILDLIMVDNNIEGGRCIQVL